MKHIKIVVILFLFFVSSVTAQTVLVEEIADIKIPLTELDDFIAEKEAKIIGIKSKNEAKVIWTTDYNKQKSPISFVYLHGFGASYREGEPIMSMLSKKYNANVYMSRLEEHGIDKENGFENLTPENYIASAKEALKIGKLIGDKIILVSTSTGGTLSLILASQENDILGLVLYSPFVDLANPAMGAIIQPGGKDYFIKMNGGEVQKQERPVEEAKYWTTSYHINGYISLMTLLKNTMNEVTFNKVNCPVFLGYYYKNEEEQDKVVSVAAMVKMFDLLGTSKEKKERVTFPESGNHVIGCDLRSKDWQSVYNKTTQFIDNVILE